MILSELGNVINIITTKRKPTVKVLWNAITELNQDQQTAIQVLQESKWNNILRAHGEWILILLMIIMMMKVICNKI